MSQDKIVITRFDLRDPKVEEMAMAEKAARKPLSPVERSPVETGLIYNPIFYTGVAGTIGAFLAWLIVEPFTGDDYHGIGLMLLFPASAAVIGLAVGLIEGVMSRNTFKALRCGGIGLGVGLAWGTVGFSVAGFIYILLIRIGATIFPPAQTEPKLVLNAGWLFMMIVARSVAWTIVSAGMGLGQGIAMASKKLLLNGLVGGMLGGFMGGLFFDPIYLICERLLEIESAAPSRAIGITVIGLAVGIFLGLVESISKEAWLIMKSGPLRGKQFILYNNPVILGSSPKCDIYIFKDPAIEPRHAEIHQIGSKFEIRDNDSPQGIFINGLRTRRKILEKGDVLVIGESILEFDHKTA